MKRLISMLFIVFLVVAVFLPLSVSAAERRNAAVAANCKRLPKAQREACKLKAAEEAAEAKRLKEKAAAEKRALLREQRLKKDQPSAENLPIWNVAEQALGTKDGTVVVMETQTGELAAVVNKDVATQKTFKPCSTIKLVTAIAAESEGLFDDNGFIIGSSCKINLEYALAKSNNPFFQIVGRNLGSDVFGGYARKLGLGQSTGVNLPRENPGRLPFGNENPRIYSHGDDTEVTALQLAVLISEISNGGKKVVPYDPVLLSGAQTFQPKSTQVPLPVEDLQELIPGITGTAKYGTASKGVQYSMGVAGKTGSCIQGGTWIGLFASVAPINDPKYTVVVITRGANARGRYSAAIAGQIYPSLVGTKTQGSLDSESELLEFENSWAD